MPTAREHQHTELKEVWRDEYLKWISGFANAQGGVLEIGRNDAGKVVGLADAGKLLVDLPNKIRDVLGILVEINLRSEAGKDYVQIVVPPYPYPVSYKGEYHVRSGSTKQELKGAALDRFLLGKQGRRWDGVPVPGVSVADLSAAALQDFRQSAGRSERLSQELLREDDTHLIDKLHLTEGTSLKRAAVLLFHSDPERWFTGAYLKIGRFQSDSELRYQDEVHGNLFAQVDRTMDLLLTKYLEARIGYAGVRRTETFPVPEEALREALLNAIAHKDYASGVPIQISVYADRIVFWNNGPLQDGWTAATLQAKHASRPPNPDIANAFFRAGMIESWGLGIEKMRQACLSRGLPAPALREEAQGLWVEFAFPALGKTPGETRVKTSGKVSGKTSGKTSGKIVAHLARQPAATIPELAALLGITQRSVERNLRKLQLDGAIKRIGAAKGGHWEVLR